MAKFLVVKYETEFPHLAMNKLGGGNNRHVQIVLYLT